MSNLAPVKLTELILDYQGISLPCPFREGHRMVPVKTVCQIIGIDFQTQDSWLKKHEIFAQLYSTSYTVGADNKRRAMNCLPMFDLYAWLSSVTDRNRDGESVKKQYTFMAWLRTQMVESYKSVEVSQEEHKYEHQLVNALADIEEQMLLNKEEGNQLKKKWQATKQSLEDVRINRLTGQTALPFD